MVIGMAALFLGCMEEQIPCVQSAGGRQKSTFLACCLCIDWRNVYMLPSLAEG